MIPSDFRFPASNIAIAVSGGADSMALLHMLATQKQDEQRIVVLTVDHGLRAESKCEAEHVAHYCRTLGIEHHILNWTGDKPLTGLQNKARAARRQLLIERCKQLNITDLFLAHQADDQIETLLQRLARGSGPNGLRGMQALTVQDGITLHRPLLHVRRAALRDYCRTHAVPFHDDPSNDDPRFERIRWRQIVQQMDQAQPGFAEGALRSQQRLHAAANALSDLAVRWLIRHQTTNGTMISLPRAELATQPPALIVEILRELMITDKNYKVDLDRLEHWVAQGFDNPANVLPETALTLGGWWIKLKKKDLTLQAAPLRQS